MKKQILVILFLICSKVFAGSATVSWNANTERDLAGYKIYYSQVSSSYTSQIYVGNVVSFRLGGLEEEKQYFFAVTALDFSGNESTFSNEVSTTIERDTTGGDPGGGDIVDNRPPSAWRVVWNSEVPFEEIVLEIVAHGNEVQDATGWDIYGHAKGNASGLYILNPEKLLISISFDAKLIGKGECLDDPKMMGIGSEDFFIGTTWRKVDFISNEERIFISFFDDCYIPETGSDANIRIENIHIFR